MTLLETVLALVLLASVFGAGGSLLAGAARTQAAQQRSAAGRLLLERAACLLREDLDHALPESVETVDDGSALFMTTCRWVGGDAPTWSRAEWRRRDDGALVRSAIAADGDPTPATRVVMTDVRGFSALRLAGPEEPAPSQPATRGRGARLRVTIESDQFVRAFEWEAAP